MRVLIPGEELVSAWWLGTPEAARRQFDELLATFSGQRAGEESLNRVELLVEGEVTQDRLIAVGEVVPTPAVIDSISLTYLAALVGLMATFGLGIGAISSPGWGVISALASGAALLVATRLETSRRALLRIVGWGLRQEG